MHSYFNFSTSINKHSLKQNYPVKHQLGSYYSLNTWWTPKIKTWVYK